MQPTDWESFNHSLSSGLDNTTAFNCKAYGQMDAWKTQAAKNGSIAMPACYLSSFDTPSAATSLKDSHFVQVAVPSSLAASRQFRQSYQ